LARGRAWVFLGVVFTNAIAMVAMAVSIFPINVSSGWSRKPQMPDGTYRAVSRTPSPRVKSDRDRRLTYTCCRGPGLRLRPLRFGEDAMSRMRLYGLRLPVSRDVARAFCGR
jgi:hypothetical protein